MLLRPLALLAALLCGAGCAGEGTLVSVSGLPEGAALLQTVVLVEGQGATDSPQIDLGPFVGRGELTFALRFPMDRSGALRVVARALGPEPERCMLALGANDSVDSTSSQLVKIALGPLLPPDCTNKSPRLIRVSPPQSSANQSLSIIGWGFQPGAKVAIAETAAELAAPVEASWVSPVSVGLRMPQLAPGPQRPVSVRLVNPDGQEDLRADILSYVSTTGSQTCCEKFCTMGCAESCTFDLKNNPDHCGTCDRACPKNRAFCIAGDCKCGNGPPCASGACLFDPATKMSRCVACVQNGDCGPGRYCFNNQCLACDQDNLCGLACTDCRTMAQFCRPGVGMTAASCVDCVEDRHCASGICNTTRNYCGTCRDDAACPGQYCDLRFYSCSPCYVEQHCGASCIRCPVAAPYCAGVTKGCAECVQQSHCQFSRRGSLCSNNSCGCSNATHCTDSAWGKLCRGSGACGCAANTDCPAGKTCNMVDGSCNL